jgi:UDP-3-O-[3-hydroxymyristoyl] glucosamine N-acyltransferase
VPVTPLTAQAVADLVGGRLIGPGDVRLTRVRALAVATPDALSLCAGPRWVEALAVTSAGAVLVTAAHEGVPGPATRIVVDDPMQAIAAVAMMLTADAEGPPGIDQTARIGRDVTIGADCRIGPHVVLGDGVVVGRGTIVAPLVVVEAGARLGEQVRLDPGVVVHAGAILGDRVHCKAGSVIGGPGFGFVSTAEGHQRIPQVGGCILESDVEVGANSCIDRGSLDDTVIGRGTKIDNLVHVGHNVRLGEHCLLMAGVGVSGSTRIGDRVVLAGQAGLVGHLDIGDDVRVGAQAGVISSVPAHGVVSGFPARPHREFLRAQAALYRLTPLVDALERLAGESDDA